jgi:hypothetical protein
MRRFFIILIMLFALPVFADTAPFYMDAIPKRTIGMYQVDKELILYSQPDLKSDVIKKVEFTFNPESMPDGMFGVLINEKQLGFLYVSDIGDDGWVEVIYDKRTKAKGWVKTADSMQFLPWLNFYNLYGRKYGLRFLNNIPEDLKVLRSKSEEDSQIVSKLNYIKQIKLTAIRGNWALVSVFDLDKVPKTGYLRWRGDDGTIYAVPNIK